MEASTLDIEEAIATLVGLRFSTFVFSGKSGKVHISIILEMKNLN